MTATELRSDGYVVHFTHFRRFKVLDTGWFIECTRGEMPDTAPAPNGGVTRCDILLDGSIVARGYAECSERDNFCRKIGRDIALGRAVAELTGKAEIRRARRESYHLAESA